MLKICIVDVPLAGCVSVEGGRIGYCCQSAEVAYGYVSCSPPKTLHYKNMTRSCVI